MKIEKLLLFGGTTEGRILAAKLNKMSWDVTVCLATEYGGSLIEASDKLHLHVGRMNRNEIEAFISSGDFKVVIDATHPYAVEASKNIKQAAQSAAVRYLRLVRPSLSPLGNEAVIYAGSPEEAADMLIKLNGNILLTTGSKDLLPYTRIPDYKQRVWVRVLPSPDSLNKCLALGFPPAHVICMQGPFSIELNAAMLRQFGIKHMVTKDTGAEGGFAEKAEAASLSGASLLLIKRRSQEDGLELMELIELLKAERAEA